MDGLLVVPPRTPEPPLNTPHPKPAGPMMDVRPPLNNNVHEAPNTDGGNQSTAPTDKQSAHKQSKVAKPKAPSQPGVGMAILASVVIVFGLAALAVYAYLKSHGIAVL